jgi:glycosyltransferase involved in cell wall biosynthesis
MRVTIVNAVYPPEPVVSARVANDLANRLFQVGMKVTVICPYPSRPFGSTYPGFQRTSATTKSIADGIAVIRVPSFTYAGSSIWGRFFESLSFGLHACKAMRQEEMQSEVVYANAWPLASQGLIANYCLKSNTPLVLHIQDVYPEAFLDRAAPFVRWLFFSSLKAIDRRSVNIAAKIVLIGDKMRDYYHMTRGIQPAKMQVVRNWVDERLYSTMPSRSAGCAKYQIDPAKFTFLYLGNLGSVSDVELLIRAYLVAGIPASQLIVAGDGPQKNAYVDLANLNHCSDIKFISDTSFENVPLIHSIADIFLLPVVKGAATSSIPSKLPYYMLSEKPVLASVDSDSETANTISTANCGWVVNAGNIAELANAMSLAAKCSSAELSEKGRRGKAFALEWFSRINGSDRLAQCVVSAGQALRPQAR